MSRLGVIVALLVVLGAIGFATMTRVTGPGWRDARPATTASQALARTAVPAPALASTAASGRPAAPVVLPVQGVAPAALTDSFSDPRGGGARAHQAIDIPAPLGTPVLAAGDGRIEKLFDSDLGGLTIYERTADGGTVYYYAHLDRYAPTLIEGQAVRAGQVLGSTGATGDADPGAPHLHFEIHRMAPGEGWWQGTAVDPYPLLRAVRG